MKDLRSHARIALTGTPVESRLSDLWSIYDFINPGLLGSSKAFTAFTKRLAKRAAVCAEGCRPFRSEPPIADEAAALEQLEQAEAAVRAAPTPRVLTRALVMLDRLFRAREIEDAASDLGALIDKYHAAARQHDELTGEDIEAEIRAARAERKRAAG